MLNPQNRDPAFEFEDFVQEITIHLAKRLEGNLADEALMWKIASNKAIDLLRYGSRRAHSSLNRLIQKDDGEIELQELIEGSPGFEEDVLVRVALEQTTPADITAIIWKGVDGYALTGAERQRLSRYKRKTDVTLLKELRGIIT